MKTKMWALALLIAELGLSAAFAQVVVNTISYSGTTGSIVFGGKSHSSHPTTDLLSSNYLTVSAEAATGYLVVEIAHVKAGLNTGEFGFQIPWLSGQTASNGILNLEFLNRDSNISPQSTPYLLFWRHQPNNEDAQVERPALTSSRFTIYDLVVSYDPVTGGTTLQRLYFQFEQFEGAALDGPAYSAGTIDFVNNLTAVPEPATYAVAVGMIVFLLTVFVRKQKLTHQTAQAVRQLVR
jgi:hypothetical protein